ncbi:MAG: hypothetical protein PHH13_01660 [Candidatus Peribacteraceae bacterium]|nr:hypothetical protein [Candidatus Peribacteraceae bacterium]
MSPLRRELCHGIRTLADLLEEAAGVEMMKPKVAYAESIRAAVRAQYCRLFRRANELLSSFSRSSDEGAAKRYDHILALEKILQQQVQSLPISQPLSPRFLRQYRRELLHLDIMHPQRSSATVNRIQKHFGLDYAQRSPSTRNRIDQYFRR